MRNFFTKDKYPAPEFETPLPEIYPKQSLTKQLSLVVNIPDPSKLGQGSFDPLKVVGTNVAVPDMLTKMSK